MINIKRGPGLSLHQSNHVGAIVAGQAIEAGHVVRLHTDGTVLKGASASPAPAAALYGFALGNQTDTDVIASGKLGIFALDGASVIETDKTAQTCTAANYPTGALVTVTTAGLIDVISGNPAAGQKVIGQVEGVRALPGQPVTINDSNGRPVNSQGPVSVVAIKLAI